MQRDRVGERVVDCRDDPDLLAGMAMGAHRCQRVVIRVLGGCRVQCRAEGQDEFRRLGVETKSLQGRDRGRCTDEVTCQGKLDVSRPSGHSECSARLEEDCESRGRGLAKRGDYHAVLSEGCVELPGGVVSSQPEVRPGRSHSENLAVGLKGDLEDRGPSGELGGNHTVLAERGIQYSS